jgi:transposase
LRSDAQAISDHAIDVTLRPRKDSCGICTGCGQRAGAYDTLAQRHFAFVPLWGMAVYLLYTRRHVNCSTCGVSWEYVYRSVQRVVAYGLSLCGYLHKVLDQVRPKPDA